MNSMRNLLDAQGGCFPPQRLAAFAVTRSGYVLALRLKKRFKGLTVFSPAMLKNHGLLKTAGAAFGRLDGLIFICASGIAVRAIAPHLKGKHLDPAVIVMDEKGVFVISLLSGHLGGANELAREIASFLKATPVITTATDNAGLACVEDIAERFSLTIEDVKKIKSANSAILSKGRVSIVDADAKRLSAMKRAFGESGVFTFDAKLAQRPGIKAFILVSDKARPVVPKAAAGRTLLLRPREFAVGIGCRRGAGRRQIARAVKAAFDAASLSMLCIRNIATIDLKRGETGLTLFARSFKLPIEYFKSSELRTIKTLSGPSLFVLATTGSPAVAEPAALLSAKAKTLWIKKLKSDRVTVAAARVSSRS